MTRNALLPPVAVLGIALGLSAASAGAPVAHSAPVQRPNVIVIMTDDQTVESLRVMPNVRRLIGNRGVTFDNSFVSFSLCCPSRATFLTGEYAHNHHVLSNTPPSGGFTALDGRNTMPVWLQHAGYATIHLGKYLNGYGVGNRREIPPGWSEWHATIDPSTYDYFGYWLNEDGRLVHYGQSARAYKTDVLTREAVDIVRRRAAAQKPFFLWASYIAPHSGGPTDTNERFMAVPAPRDRRTFSHAQLPRTAAFNEADVSDKPLFIRRRRILTSDDIRVMTERYRRRLESLVAVDEGVRRIVRALAESGELDNTLIVFTSDNGFLEGQHRIPLGKVDVYDPSTRVPLLMRGPGIPAGLHLRQPVANIDLAPTILDSAEAEAGLPMDGRSLWPLIEDAGIFWGRDILHEGPGFDQATMQFRAIRTPGFLYVEYASGEKELYDLERDPDELTNLAGDPAYAAQRDALSGRLGLLRDCVGLDCKRGPAIALTVDVTGTCPDAHAVVGIGGVDAFAVKRATFRVNGRRVASAGEGPFTADVPLSPRNGRLRVHLTLTDGRELTRDRTLPSCP
jgi:N-acetylglucosamine-6-sulfatase